MTTVGALVLAAALGLGLGYRLRLPTAVLAILAGVALDLSPLPLDGEIVRSALLLSATFLVFSVGADVDRGQIARLGVRALPIVALHVLVTVAIVAALAPLLDLDLTALGYLALALSGSSTLLVRELLRRRERVFEPVGRLVTAVVVLQDLGVVVALALLTAAATDGASGALVALGALAGLAAASGLVTRLVAPRLLRKSLGEEERLLVVLAILFAFAAGASVVGLPLVTGAYFAGLVLSRFPIGGEVQGYLAPFSDFFRALFFVLLGVIVSVPEPGELALEAALIGSVLLVRPLVLVPLVRATGLTVRSTIEAVTLLAQTGELALLVALVGVDRGHVPPRLLSVVVAVVVVTMSVVRFASADRATWRLTRWYPSRRRAGPVDQRDHVLLLGCGETGRGILELLPRTTRLVVVDDDPAVVGALEREGRTALRGNGADPETLQAAGLERAAAVISTMRYPSDNARLLRLAKGRPVLVRVFSDAQAENVRALGGHPVVEADLATANFLRWLEAR